MTAKHVVVMGVAGCGKSEVGQGIARALDLPMIEGDAFHPPSNVEKMRRGQALNDEDRAGWLQALGKELERHAGGAVLACSALKRAYRDVLRAHAPGLRFVHLRLPEAVAQQRVAARASHFMPPSLVANQFATLEDPSGEPGVVTLDATQPLHEVIAGAVRALAFNHP